MDMDAADSNAFASAAKETQGIIPRAAAFIFDEMRRRVEEAEESGLKPPEFKLSCTFLEVRPH